MKEEDSGYQYYGSLAERIRKGDSDAFTELYQNTYPGLYRYVSSFLKDPFLAQDVLQDVYISVYRDIPELKMDRLLIPWMRRIAYHICCDYSRKLKNSREISSDFTEGSFLADAASVGDEKYFQKIYDMDTWSSLEKALGKLRPGERRAFLLRYKNGLKLEEISDFTGVSLSTVKRCIRRAKEALRQTVL